MGDAVLAPVLRAARGAFRLILFDKRGHRRVRPCTVNSRRSRRAWRTCAPCSTPRMRRAPACWASARWMRHGHALRRHLPQRTACARRSSIRRHGRRSRTDWGDQFLQRVRFEWGTQEFCDELLRGRPTLFNRGPEAAPCGSRTRCGSGSSPRVSVRAQPRVRRTDMRPVLPAIKAPTLVFYREVLRRSGATPGGRRTDRRTRTRSRLSGS